MLARPMELTGDRQALRPAATADMREAAFRRARRHSRIVQALKWLLPALALVMAVAFSARTFLATTPAADVKPEGTVVADGKLVMANPKLEGLTKDNRRYSMTARRAVQDVGNQGQIQLEEIGAKLPFSAGSWATIDAPRGVYDRSNNTIALSDEVHITTTDGLAATLQSAFVDVNAGSLTSNAGVDISSNGTHITAEAMSVSNNGKVLVFDRRVRVTMPPPKTQSGNE